MSGSRLNYFESKGFMLTPNASHAFNRIKTKNTVCHGPGSLIQCFEFILVS